MKANMLLPGKVSGCDATFEIDSCAHISLVSKVLDLNLIWFHVISLPKVS